MRHSRNSFFAHLFHTTKNFRHSKSKQILQRDHNKLSFLRRQHYFVPTLQIIWCNIVTFRGWDNWPLSMILDEIQPESCIRSHWIFILIFQPALQKMWQLICQESSFLFITQRGWCIMNKKSSSMIWRHQCDIVSKDLPTRITNPLIDHETLYSSSWTFS